MCSHEQRHVQAHILFSTRLNTHECMHFIKFKKSDISQSCFFFFSSVRVSHLSESNSENLLTAKQQTNIFGIILASIINNSFLIFFLPGCSCYTFQMPPKMYKVSIFSETSHF